MRNKFKKAYYLFIYWLYILTRRRKYTYPIDRKSNERLSDGIVFLLYIGILSISFLFLVLSFQVISKHSIPDIAMLLLSMTWLIGGALLLPKCLSSDDDTWNKYLNEFEAYSKRKIWAISFFIIICYVLFFFITVKIGIYYKELHQLGLIT